MSTSVDPHSSHKVFSLRDFQQRIVALGSTPARDAARSGRPQPGAPEATAGGVKGQPLATSLFVGGFFIYAGLVVYGSMVNPFFLSQSITIGAYFNLQRLLIVVISFFVSLFFGGLFYIVFAKLTPFGVDLDDINKQPLAVGVFLFCCEVFLGLIVFASLTLPLG